MESLIERFAQADIGGEWCGFSDGNGNGHGCDDGSGKGYGNGFKHCKYGYGNGYGKDYGNGYNVGGGNGNGNGYGYGSTSGAGSGDGSGYDLSLSYYGCGGIKSINGMKTYFIDGVLTAIASVFGNIAKGYIIEFDMYLRPCYIAKHGEHFAHGETIRAAQAALEYKVLADMDTEEIITKFKERFEFGIEYPVKDFYQWHYRLTGSCEMGRKSFAKSHGIDIENDTMTVERFIELTKDSYGGNVIKELAAVYNIEGKDEEADIDVKTVDTLYALRPFFELLKHIENAQYFRSDDTP